MAKRLFEDDFELQCSGIISDYPGTSFQDIPFEGF